MSLERVQKDIEQKPKKKEHLTIPIPSSHAIFSSENPAGYSGRLKQKSEYNLKINQNQHSPKKTQQNNKEMHRNFSQNSAIKKKPVKNEEINTVKNNLYLALSNINKELNVKIENKEQSKHSFSLINFINKKSIESEKKTHMNVVEEKITDVRQKDNDVGNEDPFTKKMSKKVDMNLVIDNLFTFADISNNKTQSPINNRSSSPSSPSTSRSQKSLRRESSTVKLSGLTEVDKEIINELVQNQSLILFSEKSPRNKLSSAFETRSIPENIQVKEINISNLISLLKKKNTQNDEAFQLIASKENEISNLTRASNKAQTEIQEIDNQLEKISFEMDLITKKLNFQTTLIDSYIKMKNDVSTEEKTKISELESKLMETEKKSSRLRIENSMLKTDLCNQLVSLKSLSKNLSSEITSISQLTDDFLISYHEAM